MADIAHEPHFPTNEDYPAPASFDRGSHGNCRDGESKRYHPFINVTYSHLSKVLYQTRVLETSRKGLTRKSIYDEYENQEATEEEEDMEWEWEEMVFVRVAMDDIEDDERYSTSLRSRY